MAKLTKRDIVVAISNQTGMVQHQVFDVVQRTLDHITDSLANNVAVELRNFGVFQPRLTKPRVGRNPNEPGSSFVIPARATVKFKPGKIMRQRVEKLSRELNLLNDLSGRAMNVLKRGSSLRTVRELSNDDAGRLEVEWNAVFTKLGVAQGQLKSLRKAFYEVTPFDYFKSRLFGRPLPP